MFLPVLAADYFARSSGWPPAQLRALDFTALVAGNLGLIVLYRPGRTVLHVLAARNVAFVAAATAILALVALGTRSEAIGRWLDFAPPPWTAWFAALLVPLLVAAVLKRALGSADATDQMHPR
jgi:Ca2+-transporting ATPase